MNTPTSETELYDKQSCLWQDYVRIMARTEACMTKAADRMTQGAFLRSSDFEDSLVEARHLAFFGLTHAVLGMASEIGELHATDAHKPEELGDIAWYAAAGWRRLKRLVLPGSLAESVLNDYAGASRVDAPERRQDVESVRTREALLAAYVGVLRTSQPAAVLTSAISDMADLMKRWVFMGSTKARIGILAEITKMAAEKRTYGFEAPNARHGAHVGHNGEKGDVPDIVDSMALLLHFIVWMLTLGGAEAVLLPNMNKLLGVRYKDGFSTEACETRDLVAEAAALDGKIASNA